MADPAAEARRRALDRSLNLILLLVAVQFVLGMWLNLFGVFPSGRGSIAGALTDTAEPALVAHIAVGTVLFLSAVGVLFRAWRDPFRGMRGFAAAGLASVLFAGFSGSSFVFSGYSNNAASFAMALGFVAVLTSYYEGLVALRSHPLPAESGASAPVAAPASGPP